MLPINDIMTRNLVTVRKETPIMQAARMLVDYRITGMPVVDEGNTLVGIISEFDFLQLLTENVPTADKTVEAFMTRNVISFPDSATAIDICDFFLANPSKRRVPIVRDGKLAGIVSRSDIVRLIVGLRQDTNA